MKDSETSRERVWSYAHQGLDEAERLRVEQAMETDAELREEIRRAAQVAQYYRNLMPLMHTEDETLESQLVQEWEASDEAREALRVVAALEEADAPEASSIERKRPRTITFTVRSALALAASLLILVGGYQFYRPSPLDWTASELAPLSPRGAEESVSVYGRDGLATLSDALIPAIEASYLERLPDHLRRAKFRRAADWRLHLSLQEFDEGIVHVRVTARAEKGGPPAYTWEKYFESAAQFRDELLASSAEIAASLADMKRDR